LLTGRTRKHRYLPLQHSDLTIQRCYVVTVLYRRVPGGSGKPADFATGQPRDLIAKNACNVCHVYP
jgi:hypothetical protein